MNKNGDTLDVTCPCCASHLVVDRESGAVLAERRPKAPARSFEDAMALEKKRAGEVDSNFRNAMTTVEKEKDILEKKLKEALKKAREEKDAPPPVRPIDLD